MQLISYDSIWGRLISAGIGLFLLFYTWRQYRRGVIKFRFLGTIQLIARAESPFLFWLTTTLYVAVSMTCLASAAANVHHLRF